jgi:hypothetical protein
MNAGKHGIRHPDENLLAAFAEQTLTQQEREEVVEHLATCPPCRDAVFLAQEALPANAAQEAVGQERLLTVPQSARPWWQRPLWTLGFVAMMLAVILIAVQSYKRHQRSLLRTTQVASTEIKPPEPAPSLSRSTQTSAVPSVRAKSAKKHSVESKEKPSHESVPQPVTVESTVAMDNLPQPQAFIPAATQKHSRAPLRGEHFASAPSASTAGMVIGGIAGGVTAPANASPAAPVTTGPVAGRQISGNALHFTSHGQVPSMPPQITFRIESGVVNRCERDSCTPLPLPDRVSVVSVAFSGRNLVVLDTSGNLFASSDEGIGWETVANQWVGKARSIQLADGKPRAPADAFGQTVGKESAPADGRLIANPQMRQPPAIFELTTEEGEIWQSMDQGKTWHLKP